MFSNNNNSNNKNEQIQLNKNNNNGVTYSNNINQHNMSLNSNVSRLMDESELLDSRFDLSKNEELQDSVMISQVPDQI